MPARRMSLHLLCRLKKLERYRRKIDQKRHLVDEKVKQLSLLAELCAFMGAFQVTSPKICCKLLQTERQMFEGRGISINVAARRAVLTQCGLAGEIASDDRRYFGRRCVSSTRRQLSAALSAP